ncbi:MAG: hypothetical protein ACI9TY_000777 [Alphaproteobacteria bacterium]|jgi:hypothetical protein
MWIIISLVTVIVSCLIADWNRRHKQEIVALNFWRSLVAIISLLPFCLFGTWPSETSFYLISILIGLGSGIAAMTTFHLAAKFNGRISILHSAVAMLFTFAAWIIIDPSSRSLFIETPLKGSAICLLLISAGVSLFFMRNKSTANLEKGYLLPTILIGMLSAILTIIGKLALPSNISSDLNSKVIIMSIIIFSVQALMSFAIIYYKKYQKQSHTLHFKKHLKGRIIYLGLLGSVGCLTSWAAIALAPNPAYVKAIAMSAPILLLGYHKILKIEDKANPIAGTILAVSVILLILLQ